MKIALLGYGRMGKAIEAIAQERQHTIVYKTSKRIDVEQLIKADVAIDFSVPDAAYENITTCFQHQIPVICGTTGWLANYEKALEVCQKHNGSFLYASNFSLGVNLFFELNKYLANMMKNFSEYTTAIEEIHHTKKLDKPSGTAISLANQIIKHSAYNNWELTNKSDPSAETLPVIAKREVNVPGTHNITYQSEIDSIAITHTAHSRKGFALGAVIAAEWIADKKGVFSMKDVLKL